MSLGDFQKLIGEIYGLPDDRLYSIFDLLTQKQRFTMRALKGIRKGDCEKLEKNLLIAFSWLMAIANRMHLSVEEEVWRRFPGVCSYCGSAPCVCKKTKPKSRVPIQASSAVRPHTLAGFQSLFQTIYPADSRTFADAGVHLAEETGEVAEAVHNFLGQHLEQQFQEVGGEIADYVSCVFGVANSGSILVAPALATFFKTGCHVCKQSPCVCTFATVATLSS